MKDVLFTGKFLSIAREGRWEYAERVNATGGAILVAVTPENKLLFVEQYRIPVHARVIEFPAGILGDEANGESDADGARRELLEETGYEAEHVEMLMRGPASSGLTSEIITLFLATNLKRVHASGGVAHEEITVHEIPPPEVHDWLASKSREGILIEPKIYAGLYFLKLGGRT